MTLFLLLIRWLMLQKLSSTSPLRPPMTKVRSYQTSTLKKKLVTFHVKNLDKIRQKVLLLTLTTFKDILFCHLSQKRHRYYRVLKQISIRTKSRDNKNLAPPQNMCIQDSKTSVKILPKLKNFRTRGARGYAKTPIHFRLWIIPIKLNPTLQNNCKTPLPKRFGSRLI